MVDYVGTGGMIVDKQLFTTSPELYHIPKECALTEDLYLSYIARDAGYTLMAIEKHLNMQHDGKNQCRNLWAYKEKAFKYLRQEGWILLKDQTKN